MFLTFFVGKQTNNGIVTGTFEKASDRPDLSQLGSIWDRIWDASVSMVPDKKNGVCVTNEP
jgi:inner membrane protein